MQARSVFVTLFRLALLSLGTVAFVQSPSSAARLAQLTIAGPHSFGVIAKDVLAVHFRLAPNNAAEAGLFDDSTNAPTYDPAVVKTLVARLDKDMGALRKSNWRTWPVDQQIDARYIYAIAQDAKRQYTVERMYEYRPAQWLEALANEYIALITYAPQRTDLQDKVTAQIPAMVREMRALCTHPTERNVKTANSLIDALVGTLHTRPQSASRDAAVEALLGYQKDMNALSSLPEYRVIGAANYAWRLKHVELLPWSPIQLRTLAEHELSKVDAQRAALKPKVGATPPPTDAQISLAKSLDQQKLLDVYTSVEQQLRAKLNSLNIITVPKAVGPIAARVTPDAMVPLTGDGGSMNPPPTYVDSNVGFWNVEHFKPSMPLADRIQTVQDAQDFDVTPMGPYAVHEGVPGHHLQLSIARLNPDPIRSVLADNVQTEGWALYAEDEFQQAGGLGPSANARYNTLGSWRFRVRRVMYDVNVETGAWTLQQAADWKASKKGADVDEDVLRTINWPSQLICYFAGKMQILDLKAAYKKKLGAAYTERKFNDALLSAGSVPYALIRAKMLGTPVPDFD